MRFQPGQLVMTAGVYARIQQDAEFERQVLAAYRRYLDGDWGEVDEDDAKENERSLKHGFRLLGAYTINDTKIWIITEADRSQTTFVFPEEC